MSKTKARIAYLLILVFTAVTLFTAAVGWGPTGTGAAKNIKLGLDLSGGVSITYQATETHPSQEDMKDTIYKLQQRVSQYSTEASVYQEGDNRINVEIPGVTDANKILEELGKPGSLSFTLEDGTQILDGTEVDSARAATQASSLGGNENVVQLHFTEEGAKAFADATSENVGKTIQIVYDGTVISAPTVNEAITNGDCVISGSFTAESAESLASFIRIGSLSLELEEIRSNVVGAQLGSKALSTSLAAGAAGLAIVILFMLFIYRIPGMIAALSLVLYTGLELVMINAFDMTLTLSGIAGVILSIGMAVDANIIIYARIREEVSKGYSVGSSIKTGFKKALTAILDGNITTLIAAAVLNFMATGSVKGFAQTLALGIILSMFTACVISRILAEAAYALGMDKPEHFGKAPKKRSFHVIGKSRLFFAIAILAVLCGPAAMGIQMAQGNGILNLSMEFRGGTATDAVLKEDYSIDEIEKEIAPVIREVIGEKEAVQAQKVAGGNEVLFKTRALSVEEREALSAKLDEAFGLEKTEEGAARISFETISSTISHEMRKDAAVAVAVAIVLMLIYIWIRFSDVRFAASAVICLVHDVLVVFACYAILRIPVGNTLIACMLTIVGYSINATIVVFDRLRENLKSAKGKESLEDICNRSILDTLTRNIYTTFTTFVTLAALFILGVASIREFTLPLMAGVLAGGFSSTVLASSIWLVARKVQKKQKK